MARSQNGSPTLPEMQWVRSAQTANILAYMSPNASYIDGAPHLKHTSLKNLYVSLLTQAYDRACVTTTKSRPTALDLGAGDGYATVPLLQLGADVLAVDISESQLAGLSATCEPLGLHPRTRRCDVFEALANLDERFDLVVANSFIHHVPDYLAMLKLASALLEPGGQILTFQDPMRYDRLPAFTRLYSEIAYFFWRIRQGDAFGGLQRKVRRLRGIYLEDSVHDNAEYHATRNGVDHEAILRQQEDGNFRCKVFLYFSTFSPWFQRFGERLRLANTFALLMEKTRTPSQ